MSSANSTYGLFYSTQIVLVDDASNHTDISTTLPLYIKSRLPSKVF